MSKRLTCALVATAATAALALGAGSALAADSASGIVSSRRFRTVISR